MGNRAGASWGWRRGGVVAAALVSSACVASAGVDLKGPISAQCRSAGLNGCAKIAAGAAWYADGRQHQGQRALSEGLNANPRRAAELKEFASAMTLIAQVAGDREYRDRLQPALALIRAAAIDAQQASLERSSETPATPDVTRTVDRRIHARPLICDRVPSIPLCGQWPAPEERPRSETVWHRVSSGLEPQIQSRFVTVAGSERMFPCLYPGLEELVCVRQLTTPVVVTDIVIPTSCPHDMVVGSGIDTKPSWIVQAPAGEGASIHGAGFPVGEGEMYEIAYCISGAARTAEADARCGVSIAWRAAKTTRGGQVGPQRL